MKPEDIERAPSGRERFYFTFGAKYDRQPHPRLRVDASTVVFIDVPEGVEAYGLARAKWRTIVFPHFAPLFANQYTYDEICQSADYWERCVPIESVLWSDVPEWIEMPSVR